MASIYSVQLEPFGQSGMGIAIAENVCSILWKTSFHSKVLQIPSVLMQWTSPYLIWSETRDTSDLVVEVVSECTAGWCWLTWCLYVEKKGSLLTSHFAQGIFSAVSLLVCFVKILPGLGQHLSTWLWTECPADFWKDMHMWIHVDVACNISAFGAIFFALVTSYRSSCSEVMVPRTVFSCSLRDNKLMAWKYWPG